jgi:hypothetical protein
VGISLADKKSRQGHKIKNHKYLIIGFTKYLWLSDKLETQNRKLNPEFT